MADLDDPAIGDHDLRALDHLAGDHVHHARGGNDNGVGASSVCGGNQQRGQHRAERQGGPPTKPEGNQHIPRWQTDYSAAIRQLWAKSSCSSRVSSAPAKSPIRSAMRVHDGEGARRASSKYNARSNSS